MKDPGPVLGSSAKAEIDAKVGKKGAGGASAVTSILVSRADDRIYVLQGGAIVAEGSANIKDPSKPIGSHVFIWQDGDKNGSTWHGMGFHAEEAGAVKPDSAVLERIEGSGETMDAIKKRLKPGTVLVTTDLAATPDTRTDKSMVVMDAPAK